MENSDLKVGMILDRKAGTKSKFFDARIKITSVNNVAAEGVEFFTFCRFIASRNKWSTQEGSSWRYDSTNVFDVYEEANS